MGKCPECVPVKVLPVQVASPPESKHSRQPPTSQVPPTVSPLSAETKSHNKLTPSVPLQNNRMPSSVVHWPKCLHGARIRRADLDELNHEHYIYACRNPPVANSYLGYCAEHLRSIYGVYIHCLADNDTPWPPTKHTLAMFHQSSGWVGAGQLFVPYVMSAKSFDEDDEIGIFSGEIISEKTKTRRYGTAATKCIKLGTSGYYLDVGVERDSPMSLLRHDSKAPNCRAKLDSNNLPYLMICAARQIREKQILTLDYTAVIEGVSEVPAHKTAWLRRFPVTDANPLACLIDSKAMSAPPNGSPVVEPDIELAKFDYFGIFTYTSEMDNELQKHATQFGDHKIAIIAVNSNRVPTPWYTVEHNRPDSSGTCMFYSTRSGKRVLKYTVRDIQTNNFHFIKTIMDNGVHSPLSAVKYEYKGKKFVAHKLTCDSVSADDVKSINAVTSTTTDVGAQPFVLRDDSPAHISHFTTTVSGVVTESDAHRYKVHLWNKVFIDANGLYTDEKWLTAARDQSQKPEYVRIFSGDIWDSIINAKSGPARKKLAKEVLEEWKLSIETSKLYLAQQKQPDN